MRTVRAGLQYPQIEDPRLSESGFQICGFVPTPGPPNTTGAVYGPSECTPGLTLIRIQRVEGTNPQISTPTNICRGLWNRITIDKLGPPVIINYIQTVLGR